MIPNQPCIVKTYESGEFWVQSGTLDTRLSHDSDGFVWLTHNGELTGILRDSIVEYAYTFETNHPLIQEAELIKKKKLEAKP